MLLEKEFKQFHENIKGTYLSDLIEKRTILESKLRSDLVQKFKDKGYENITINGIFDQGSYSTYTLIKPRKNANDVYDRDVALALNIESTDDIDPIEVKKIVRETLLIENKRIPEINGPCVTVRYKETDKDTNELKEVFHIDLPIYAVDTNNNYMLARGTEFGNKENQFWEDSAPNEITNYINTCVEDSKDREQFRRIIKYLKQWKATKFSSVSSDGTPPSIGLTLLTCENFEPFKENNKYDDLSALLNVVQAIYKEFYSVYDNGNIKKTIVYNLKEKPFTDIFKKMTLNYKNDFYEKILKLKEALEKSKAEGTDHKAAKVITSFFGGEEIFPVPEEQEEDRALKNTNKALGVAEFA